MEIDCVSADESSSPNLARAVTSQKSTSSTNSSKPQGSNRRGLSWKGRNSYSNVSSSSISGRRGKSQFEDMDTSENENVAHKNFFRGKSRFEMSIIPSIPCMVLNFEH